MCYGDVGDKHVWMKISWPANLLSIKTPVRFLGFPLFYRGLLFRFFSANRVIPGTNMVVWKCYDIKEKPYLERIKEQNNRAVKEVLE